MKLKALLLAVALSGAMASAGAIGVVPSNIDAIDDSDAGFADSVGRVETFGPSSDDPRPEILVLLLAGVGAIGILTRRRGRG